MKAEIDLVTQGVTHHLGWRRGKWITAANPERLSAWALVTLSRHRHRQRTIMIDDAVRRTFEPQARRIQMSLHDYLVGAVRAGLWNSEVDEVRRQWRRTMTFAGPEDVWL